jgi:methylglutaconyl-CoA hydratase
MLPPTSAIETTIERGVARIELNRPEVHNAFDGALIQSLTETLKALESIREVRVLVLTGRGTSFSAGADLNWMRSMAKASEAENLADALKLAELMRTLAFHPKPTIARVNGNAFGGGVGLVACCDLAIAQRAARFGLTETKLGLVPAVISPYVIAAIGARHARRLFQTAEIFSAALAERIDLVHQVVEEADLDAAVEEQCALLRRGGPQAVATAKQLVQSITGRTREDQERIDRSTAALIARLRVSSEGQEGLSAFLDKRKANWIED